MNIQKPIKVFTFIAIFLAVTTYEFDADTIQFADPNLESCVSDAIEESPVTTEAVANLRQLNCNGRNISDLAGIDDITSLEYLYLNNNNLTSVAPIGNLPNLMYLQLYSNDLNSISDLSSLTGLRQLLVDDNNLTDLSPVANFRNLVIFSANDNQITSISDLAGLTMLRELNLVNNNISNIDSLENLTSLQKLRLENNDITSIDKLSNLANLKTVNLSNNQITSIEALSGNSALSELYVDSNQLTNLKGLENLSGLTSFRARNNQITEIPKLSKLSKLKNISLSYNLISDASPLGDLQNVEAIYINYNQISDLSSLNMLGKLKTVYAYDQSVVSSELKVGSNSPVSVEIVDAIGNTKTISMNVTQFGSDTLAGEWNMYHPNFYFSGTFIQPINYVPTSRLTGKTIASIDEQASYSDAKLIELFKVENSKSHKISVDKSAIDYSSPGTYKITFSDEDLNTMTSRLVINDVKPRIDVKYKTVDIIIGQRIDNYVSAFGISATELKKGDLQSSLKIDDSNVNYNKAGTYTINLSVSDKQNNTTKTTVKLNIQRRHVTITNPDGAQIVVYKTSMVGTGLPGYEYTIFDKEGNPIEVIVTDNDGYVSSSILPPGDYYLEQTGAPSGEHVSNDRLSITETINVVNVGSNLGGSSDNGTSNVTVNLQGSDNSNVGVYLTGRDGEIVDYAISDEDGSVTFEGIELGKYQVVIDNLSSRNSSFNKQHSIEVTDNDDSIFNISLRSGNTSIILLGLVLLLLIGAVISAKVFKKK